MVMLKVSRSVKEDPGDDGDEERHPRMPDEPENKSRDRGDTQVDPGGETETERNESVALESMQRSTERPQGRAEMHRSRWRAQRCVRKCRLWERNGALYHTDDQ